jgi:hypothetical protein
VAAAVVAHLLYLLAATDLADADPADPVPSAAPGTQRDGQQQLPSSRRRRGDQHLSLDKRPRVLLA